MAMIAVAVFDRNRRPGEGQWVAEVYLKVSDSKPWESYAWFASEKLAIEKARARIKEIEAFLAGGGSLT